MFPPSCHLQVQWTSKQSPGEDRTSHCFLRSKKQGVHIFSCWEYFFDPPASAFPRLGLQIPPCLLWSSICCVPGDEGQGHPAGPVPPFLGCYKNRLLWHPFLAGRSWDNREEILGASLWDPVLCRMKAVSCCDSSIPRGGDGTTAGGPGCQHPQERGQSPVIVS